MNVKISKVKKILIIVTVIILFVIVKLLDIEIDPYDKLNNKNWIAALDLNPTEEFEKDFLKIFHLDLKGGAPKINYLLKVLPLIRESGANAILIEYEDMFPFSGQLRNISARNAYSLKEIKIIIEFARSLEMEVIPLIQTFGHLEYVLKLKEFQSLRESTDFPQEICPSNRKAVDLVKEMIKQIMEVHSKSKYVHIGCDEIRNLGVCPKCSRINSKKLFSTHVNKIANYIKSQYPKVTPLIWDDMLRRWTFNDMENSGLASAVEPVVWVYGSRIFPLVPSFVWNSYQRIFPKLWVASSFKGGLESKEFLPNLTFHLKNHLFWMRILTRKEKEITLNSKISGIFITGWSRFDHFAVLCELLPVGIPSLVLSLTFLDPSLRGNHSKGFVKWLKILQCPPKYLQIGVNNETFFQTQLGNCSFPGSDFYSEIIKYDKLLGRVRKVTEAVESSGWTSSYNFRNNFTSPWRLLRMFPKEGFAGEILKKDICLWKSSFLLLMTKYFDEYTIREWEEQNIIPLEKKLEEIKNSFSKLIRKKYWPRRPLG